MKAYVFPGQGSQVKGMGKALFEKYPELTQIADEVLGYSIKTLCLDDPEKQLGQTQFTQPALYVVNALSYKQKIDSSGEYPDFLAGHSLGEYNALEASGALSFKDGLRLVQKRGQLMSQAPKGAMAAIMGASVEDIKSVLGNNNLESIDIANYNSTSQTVLSGLEEDIEKAQVVFDQRKIRCVRLNTSGAFHSRYMEPSKVEFEKYLKGFEFSEIKIPVISNVYAKPYQQCDIAKNLSEQISHSVKWFEGIKFLFEQGEMEFEEVGVGRVLTRLIQDTRKQVSEGKELLGKPITEANIEVDGDKDNLTTHQKIEDWNKRFSIGTQVAVEGYDKTLETRTEAVVLFGHRAAIYMQGYNGYFALEEIKPI